MILPNPAHSRTIPFRHDAAVTPIRERTWQRVLVVVGIVVLAFNLRPAAIIEDLDLLRPIYAKTAAYGHFGRELPEFTWERTDRADALKQALGR